MAKSRGGQGRGAKDRDRKQARQELKKMGPVTRPGPRRRSVVQFRSETDARKYAPDRDIAWNFLPLVKQAVSIFDNEDKWADWLGEYLRYAGVTRDDLSLCVQRYAEAYKLFHGEPGIHEPHDALRQTKFFESPKAAQLAVAAAIGQVMTGAFFIAIRDVSEQGAEPPQRRDIDSLVAAAGKVACGWLRDGSQGDDDGGFASSESHERGAGGAADGGE